MTAETFAIIIPARYASSRFPGKPLEPLLGAAGQAKPLIQRTWECAMRVAGAASVHVATDDERIADTVRAFGGEVILTPAHCRNGTERCAAAAKALENAADIVVNLQGDAPLTCPDMIAALVERLRLEPETMMATPGLACSPQVYRQLLSQAEAGHPGAVTVVTSASGRALYFSRRMLPYVAPQAAAPAVGPRLHLGVYAYRLAALAAYAERAPAFLEECEDLEQLRFLEADQIVRVVPFDPPPWNCIELNHHHDKPAIEAVLMQRGMA